MTTMEADLGQCASTADSGSTTGVVKCQRPANRMVKTAWGKSPRCKKHGRFLETA